MDVVAAAARLNQGVEETGVPFDWRPNPDATSVDLYVQADEDGEFEILGWINLPLTDHDGYRIVVPGVGSDDVPSLEDGAAALALLYLFITA